VRVEPVLHEIGADEAGAAGDEECAHQASTGRGTGESPRRAESVTSAVHTR
jgi:hypothetical protein